MTEMDWKLKVPLKEKEWPHREVELLEKLLESNRKLIAEGYRHGMYNFQCSIVPEEGVAQCSVTTYGDLPWLPKALKPIAPQIEVKRADRVHKVSDEELQSLKKWQKLYPR